MYPRAAQKNAAGKKHPVAVKSDLTLETLNPRVLLNADTESFLFNSDELVLQDSDNSNYIDAETYLNDYVYNNDGSYALPAIMQVDEAFLESLMNGGTTVKANGHPVWCTCPMCVGLSDSSIDEFGNTTDNALEATQAADAFFSLTGSSAQTSILYLEFNGDTVYRRSGDFNIGSDAVEIPAYDLSMYGWGGQEAQSIDYIVDFVREDYAAYNIEVVTEKPTSGDYTTLYVGGSNDWFRPGSSVIGVATYDVGNRNDTNYGFAFSEELSIYYNYSGGSLLRFSEYLANLVSHEAAHTYGANHVDDTTALMNPYLPITPYTSMFGSGNIPGTTTVQDTQSLLGSNIGYVGSSDDFGSTVSTASPINPGSTISGLLERRDDADVFTFTATSTGSLQAEIITQYAGNLDPVLTIYSHSTSQIIAQNDDYGQSLDSLTSFNVVTGQQYSIIVTSAYSNSSGSYTLSLSSAEPAPQMQISDNVGSSTDQNIDFGAVTLDSNNQASFTIQNTGSDDLVIHQLWTNDSFTLSHTSTDSAMDDITIAPGSDLDIAVTFNPQSYGDYTGTVTLVTNDADNTTATISLAGHVNAPAPDITLAGVNTNNGTASLDFGDIYVGQSAQQTVTIVNDGTDVLNINGLGITSDFTVISGFTGSVLSINPQQSVNIVIEAAPAAHASLNGRMTLVTNDPDESVVSIQLVGQAVAPVLTVSENAQIANDGKIDFGTLYLGESDTYTITVSNTGDADLILNTINIDGSFQSAQTISANNSTLTLTPGQTLDIPVSFTPQAQGLYDGTVTIATADGQNADLHLYAVALEGGLEIIEMDNTPDNAIDLGAVDVAHNNEVSAYRLVNHSQSVITVNLDWQNGHYFTTTNDAAFTLNPGQIQTIQIVLDTDYAANLTDTLTVTTTGPGATTQTLTVNADAYATVSQGNDYRFTNTHGDDITVKLNGNTAAQVRLDAVGDLDIASILFNNGSANNFTISSKGDSLVRVGEIAGTAQFKNLKLDDVEIVDSLTIDGDINKLALADTGSHAVIDINGQINRFKAEHLDGDCLYVNSLTHLQTQTSLDMNIEVRNGDLDRLRVLDGDLNASVTVNKGTLDLLLIKTGDLNGAVQAQGSIGKVMVRKGSILGAVHSDAQIGVIIAEDLAQADIQARNSIDTVKVDGSKIDPVAMFNAAAQPAVLAHTDKQLVDDMLLQAV